MKQFSVSDLIFFLDKGIIHLSSRIEQDKNTTWSSLSFIDIKERDMLIEIKEILQGSFICEYCKNPFPGKRKNARFCSNNHRLKYFRANDSTNQADPGKLPAAPGL